MPVSLPEARLSFGGVGRERTQVGNADGSAPDNRRVSCVYPARMFPKRRGAANQ